MNTEKVKKTPYSFLITLTGAILMLAMLVLPYASAKREYKEYLKNNKDKMYAEEIGMTNSAAVNISLIEFIRIYSNAAQQERYKAVGIACIIMIVIYAIFAALTFLMAMLRKPIGIMIFDLLTLGIFGLIHFDFEDRGVIPSSSYNWGITNFLTYIVGAVIIAGAVWMFVEKRRVKAEQNMPV